MSLDLYVGETGGEYRVAELYVLLWNLEVYGHHPAADFPLLSEMIKCVDGSFDPRTVLEETERLESLLAAEQRPYARPADGLSRSDLLGLRYSPRALEPAGQLVRVWERPSAEPGHPVEMEPPCSLVADEERLHLVEATLEQLGQKRWDSFYHVGGKQFRWEEGLWVDGERLETTPRSFRLDCHGWGTVVHTTVPVVLAWEPELAELVRACRQALELGVPLEASI